MIIFKGSRNDESDRSFTFFLNEISVTTLNESIPIYGVWDYIYEIGGWIGLFLGYSVVSAFDDIVSTMDITRLKFKSFF